MKKLILSLAVVLGSLSIYASTVVNAEQVKLETTMQSDFNEILIGDLPVAVTTALEESYPGAIVEKAYSNTENEYKLDISVDGSQASVYLDADGNWLKI